MSNLSLCKYKDLFGKPGEGVHSIRIFNIAVVDVLATLLFAFGLHIVLEKYIIKKNFSIWITIIISFILGIISHRLFCVRTTIDKLLFK
jgi:magnesium-transporting ATPase (P-type)